MKTVYALFLAGVVTFAPGFASARPDFKEPFAKGVVFGKVLDGCGKPVADATVVMLARTGKVLTWSVTDADGYYALAANPKVALDIEPSRNRGLLRMCATAAGEVAMAPVKAFANMVANPGLTVAAAGVSIASGTPAPIEAQAIAAQVPNHQTAVQTQLATQGAVAAQALGVGIQLAPQDLSTEGQAVLLIEAPGFKKAAVKVAAYWLEPPTKDNGYAEGLRAWVDTVKMAPAAAKEDTQVQSEAFTLCEAKVTPTLAPADSDIRISVKMTGPSDESHQVRVFARECPRNQVIELKPGKDKDVYEGTMHLDRLCSLGDATICICALRNQPLDVKLDTKNTRTLITFVKRLEYMEAGKQYGYDPMILASQNRQDVKLLVLSPKAETPPIAIKH